MLNDTIYKGKSQKVSKVLMLASKNRIKLFQGVEQGHGHNQNRIYACCKRGLKMDVQDQIREKCRKYFRVQDKADYSSSVPLKTKEDYDYNADI